MIKEIAGAILGLSLAVGPLSATTQAAEKGKVEKPAKPAKKTSIQKLVLHRGKDGGLFEQPVYNPATRSYFELVRANPKVPTFEINWATAKNEAAGRIWKGVHGRLAIVKTRQVHDFLRDTFRSPTMAWIGLRYMCNFNTLIWVTGQIQPRSGFAYWDPVWDIDGTAKNRSNYRTRTCSSNRSDYWPVQYWPMWRGFRWNANGKYKKAGAYFIEYPTGKR